MIKKLIPLVAFMAITSACNKGEQAPDLSSNPFVNPKETYFSAPDFSAIATEHYLPAFEEGIRLHNLEIEEIANNPEAPTFENTLVALEKSGQVLNRVATVFFALTSADTNDELIKIEEEITPKLSDHSDGLFLNEKLFQRIKAIYESDKSNLQPEDIRLIEHYYNDFVMAGALLNLEQKEELKKLNQQEASLLTDFGNRLTKATNALIFFTNKEELKGLSEEELQAAAKRAEEAGHAGEYGFSLTNTTQQDIMANLDVRETRKRILTESMERCTRNNEYNTEELVLKIARLRAQKAVLLGFPNYASWAMQDQLAKKPENAINMLSKIAKLARPKAEEDRKTIEAFARKTEGKDFVLEAWDWSYFAERMRSEQYGIDEATISQYLALDSVLYNGVFYAAGQMYGISFKPRTDVSVYHPDVRVWDVIDKDGNTLALYYFDPYARPSKSGGAWMSNFVEQSYLLDLKPVVYNVCNFKKPAEGEVCLLSWDQTETLFHEFGHALHGMFSAQKYPSISGTSTPRDFVEMPSQFNEHAANDPAIFAHFAKHYKTGEVMPKELVEKMHKAKRFNQAYGLVENVGASLLDQAWHKLSVQEAEAITSVTDFQLDAIKKADAFYTAIPPRYITTTFRHIWSNGYSAGYYAYLWTEALDNEIFAWMQKNGGLTRENGERLRSMILSRGNSQDLMTLFTEFTGHQEVDINPLLQARGLK